MATQTQPAKPKFSDMSAGEKVIHVGKIVIFFVSFGFAFPTLFSD